MDIMLEGDFIDCNGQVKINGTVILPSLLIILAYLFEKSRVNS